MIASFDGEYRFLSNFWPCKLTWGHGIRLTTVEHVYQASKCALREQGDAIMRAPTPGQAKRLGKQAALRRDWDRIKFDVMYKLVYEKFHNPELMELLLATEDEELVEGNSWGDRIWGQCPVGVGENRLGKILMRVRTEIRNEQAHLRLVLDNMSDEELVSTWKNFKRESFQGDYAPGVTMIDWSYMVRKELVERDLV